MKAKRSNKPMGRMRRMRAAARRRSGAPMPRGASADDKVGVSVPETLPER
ncbi:hypothetical protein F8B43_4745 [Methylorubrum populi]|uniref:Uncharacterized protein n=1 Tax=Methylorubrum populi TaxID=223967 RepID=A0A833IZY4_9HYPH|nr:hypothetical protein F8B43_4745 [Methylorubrum populi]